MKNIDNRELVGEVEESPFEVMSTGDAVNFTEYVDPRESDYYESTISEYEKGVYNDSTVTDNDFYDDLESQFGAEDEGYDYVRMKNFQNCEDQVNENVGNVLKSTKGNSSNAATITSLQNVLDKNSEEYDLAA